MCSKSSNETTEKLKSVHVDHRQYITPSTAFLQKSFSLLHTFDMYEMLIFKKKIIKLG